MTGLIPQRMIPRVETAEMTISARLVKYLWICLSLFIPFSGRGQQKDFQSWWEAGIEKSISKGFNLTGEIGQRFRNNTLQYDRTQLTLGGEYEVNDYLRVGAGFRGLIAGNREQELNARYRLDADATGRYSIARFNASLRFRLQYGFEDLVYRGQISHNTLANRFRLKAAYHIAGTRFDCFVSVESWYLLSKDPRRLFYKIRYSGGAAYNLSFKSSLNIRYILEDEFHMENPLQSYILAAGFAHKL